MRLTRSTAVVISVVAAALAGVGAASALTPSGAAPEDEGSVPAVVAGSAGVDAAAPDPAGGPDWVVARFVNDEQRECAVAGRSIAGQFGRLDGDGSFVPLAIGPGGVCGDPASELMRAVAVYPGGGSNGARTIFFGVSVSAGAYSVLAPDGSRHDLAPGERGGFLVVAEGQHTLSDWVLEPAPAP